MSTAVAKSSNAKYKPKMVEERLRSAFGASCVYVEIQDGWQARFAHAVYTFYTGLSHKVNVSPNRWMVYVHGQEIEFIKADLEYQAEKKPEPPRITSVTEKYVTPAMEQPSGLDAFVKHIKQKLTRYRKKHPQPNKQETEAMVIMMALIGESEQFQPDKPGSEVSM